MNIPSNEQATGRPVTPAAMLSVLGIVFGDIGTSPLYALRECFGSSTGITPSPDNVIGVVSLIFWSLIAVVTVKYVWLIMRADNAGEGGILALMALALRDRRAPRWRRVAVAAAGIFGAALFFGDGMITPAISVLSAVEGLAIGHAELEPAVIPATIAILVGLFAVQARGTARVGSLFGPIMVAWFATLAGLGIIHIFDSPRIVGAVDPTRAVGFLLHNGFVGFIVLGAVFLVVTGCEALYADMGHFGRAPIRRVWVAFVLPALVLNYFGQGGLVLSDPEKVASPFFLMVEGSLIYPLIALATVATVIASQAVISGVFSLTRQAIQLGLWPRVRMVHTSEEEIGQIYVPFANWALLAAVVALVVGFGSSSALAAAYGIAVSATMVITTPLALLIAWRYGRWPLWKCVAVGVPFAIVDLTFFLANGLKLGDGGWFPLLAATIVYMLMTTWRDGRALLRKRLAEDSLPLSGFVERLASGSAHRVPGTAIFLTANADRVPHTLLHNMKHNKVLHQRVVFLTVVVDDVPRVADDQRIRIRDLAPGFHSMVVRYGFMEDSNIPRALALASAAGTTFEPLETTFFVGRETLIATRQPGLALWREKLFATMSRNAENALDFFRLPTNRVIELGTQVEL